MAWRERYALNTRPFGEEPMPFLREVFEQPEQFALPAEQLRILCPGDGYGRNSLWLAQRGHAVVGLDLVPAAVGRALTAAVQSDVNYVAIPADISGLPFPLCRGTSFDAIVPAWIRLPEEDARRAWNAECMRCLRAGGVVVFIGGRRVTDAAAEQAQWPCSMRWKDFSTEDEVRLVGHKSRRHRRAAPTRPGRCRSAQHGTVLPGAARGLGAPGSPCSVAP